MDKVIIIGGGISGLSLAYYLRVKKPSINIMVLESSNRLGGKIWTERERGFVCEAGVNGFLDNKRGAIDLSLMVGLKPIKSNDSARKRYIYINKKLRLIPDSPLKFLFSDIMTLKGKLRIPLEYFIPKADIEDESLESFALRRVGREFLERLLDPMVTGIYAGDPSMLSVRSCFPKVYELEKNYGGLIKGFITLKKQAKKSGKKIEAGPGGTLHSYYEGMYTIIESLRSELSTFLLTNKEVVGINRKGEIYEVVCSDGSIYESGKVVLATPAYNSAMILKDLDTKFFNLLNEIPYPPISVVAMGFLKEKIKVNTDYFGFLVPKIEKRKILGCLFDSSIFPNRAPEDHILLRCMLGGVRNPELVFLDDEKTVSIVIDELKDIAGIDAEPDFIKIFRYEKAIPQYTPGHYERLNILDEILKNFKGLYITGNAMRGVAMNDCISQSDILSEKILKEN